MSSCCYRTQLFLIPDIEKSISSDVKLPTDDDLKAVADYILRLHRLFNLDTSLLASGIISGMHTHALLTGWFLLALLFLLCGAKGL